MCLLHISVNVGKHKNKALSKLEYWSIGDGDFKTFNGQEWLEWNVLKINKRAIPISAPL